MTSKWLLRGVQLGLMGVLAWASPVLAQAEMLVGSSDGLTERGAAEGATHTASDEMLAAALAAPEITSPTNNSWINQVRPMITGTVAAGLSVRVYINDTEAGIATVDEAGHWTFVSGADLADGSYSVSAEAEDTGGTLSPRSSAITFSVDTIPPETGTYMAPGGETSSRSAEFHFTTEYLSYIECSLDNAPFMRCDMPYVLNDIPDGLHTMRARGVDRAGNVDPWPEEASWLIDSTPPETTIVSPSQSPTNARPVVIRLESNESNVSYQCLMNGVTLLGCRDQAGYYPPAEGSYVLSVSAKDSVGNIDPTPATYSFIVDYTAPEAPVLKTPLVERPLSEKTLVISGTAEAGSVVKVTIDGSAVNLPDLSADETGRWSFTPSALADGSHTVRATATDAAGNVSPESNPHTFAVDTLPPRTTFINAPKLAPGDTDISITFTSEEEVTFECELDVGGVEGTRENCTSPFALTGLSEGKYTLRVWAKDRAGNEEPTPAIHSWEVKAKSNGCSSFSGDPSLAMMALAGLAALVFRRRRN